MPPRRGGRGRGAGGRPPQAVRNAMAELGRGSLATYELLAQAAARSNVDAARGYFPMLEPNKKAPPIHLYDSEMLGVKLSQDVRRSIAESPHFIESREKKQLGEWQKEISALGDYFYTGKTVEKTETKNDELWDNSKCWFIAELLPIELIPKKSRVVKREQKEQKRTKVGNGAASFVGRLKDEALINGDGDAADGAEEEEDDGAEANEGAVDNGEDDDLELDADYQTGIKFDDDEGYEEQDSGAEEATF